VFGKDFNYAPIGRVYPELDAHTNPNRYQGNYFLPDVPEGMVLPMAVNQFHYPHPHMCFDDMFPGPEPHAASLSDAA
jgi:hypothetical protein